MSLLDKIPTGPIDVDGAIDTLDVLHQVVTTNINPEAFSLCYTSTPHVLAIAPHVGTGRAKKVVDAHNQTLHDLGRRHTVIMCQNHVTKLHDAYPAAHFHSALSTRADALVYLRPDGETDHPSAPYGPWLDWWVLCGIECPDLPDVHHLATAFSLKAGERETTTNAMAVSARRTLELKIQGAPTSYPALYATLGTT